MIQPQITKERHLIHEGEHYYANIVDGSVVSGAVKQWLLVFPSRFQVHLTFGVKTDVAGTLKLYENADPSSKGTEKTLQNNNRRKPNDCHTRLYADPTMTSNGTLISTGILAAGLGPRGVGGSSQEGAEQIFYDDIILITCTNESNSEGRVGLHLALHEHGD